MKNSELYKIKREIKEPIMAYIHELGASGRQCGGQETRNQNVRRKNLTQYKVNF